MVPVVHFRAFEAEEDELYEDSICISEREDGALGSTGNTSYLVPSAQQELSFSTNTEEPLPHPLNDMPSGF